QFPVEESPWILGTAQNPPLLVRLLREERAHGGSQCFQDGRRDPVVRHLEKTPVPTGGIDGLQARGLLQFRDVYDGNGLGHLPALAFRRSSSAAASSATASKDRFRRLRRRQRRFAS